MATNIKTTWTIPAVPRGGTVVGGVSWTWGAEHRDGTGRLISRQASIEPPAAPKCLRIDCLMRYLRDATFYVLLANYHARRVAYAEANRHKEIPDRYRTGESSPMNLWQAIHANIKIACPICRKYNVDPLLFRRTET